MEEIVHTAENARSDVFAGWMISLEHLQGVSFRTLEQDRLVEEMAKMVDALAPWKVFATHTFRWNASLSSAGRVYRRFMDRMLPSISFFYAVELHPGGHGGHIHALWDSLEAPRIATHKEWLKRYGGNRIEPVRSFDDVVQYCSKVAYLLKQDRCWWDYHLSRAQFAKVARPVVQPGGVLL
jgi:hypothetical protein